MFFCLVGLMACHEEYINPYDQQEIPNTPTDSTSVELSATSFTAIHARILSPTCARSGCHDGNFEPDFRTVESSYNTLVDHPIIKNDPQNSYQVRVRPGSPEESLLIARLTRDIDGNSGIMPLSVDSNSDWEEQKDLHIQNIRTWITQGARR
ncbi:MAG: hypothetical protein AAGD05_05455 [Bacteroidota bacterium]